MAISCGVRTIRTPTARGPSRKRSSRRTRLISMLRRSAGSFAIMRLRFTASTARNRTRELCPALFGFLVLAAAHAAFRVIAFERVVFPRDTVTVLFHQLLSFRTENELSQQNRRVWMRRSGDNRRAAGICGDDVQRYPFDRR